MKNLLLISPIILLGSCSYNSMHQAKQACEEWASLGGNYKISYQREACLYSKRWRVSDNFGVYFTNRTPNCHRKETITTNNLRWCIKEQETTQYLGFTKANRKQGQVIYIKGDNKNILPPQDKLSSNKLIRRFNY